MKQSIAKAINLNNKTFLSGSFVKIALIGSFLVAALLLVDASSAQTAVSSDVLPPTPFKVGEKITYGINYGRFRNVGFAEIYAVSRGKLEGRDAVELRARVRTTELVSAAFLMVDETRTTFAAADSGLPLYVRKVISSGVVPVDTNTSFLNNPTQNLDLITAIYRLRTLGGTGTLSFQEGERNFSVTAQQTVAERVKTDVGDFDTVVSTIQSEFLTESGLRDFRVNFSSDERKLPVLVRFKTEKGDVEFVLATIQSIVPEPEVAGTRTPTPTPVATPKPTVTPTPSRDNLPLSTMLPFELGETLDYRITTGGAPVGTFRMQAAERKFVDSRDVLVLKSTITGAEPGNNIFAVNDFISAQVNAESLSPFQFDARFTGGLSSFNQSIRFDQQRGIAFFGGENQLQIPIHTHSLLSLAYAIRSFNLRPSKDSKNPVNDTRVAVFYDSQFYIFTVRPLGGEIISYGNEKISVQMLTIITGNPQLDSLGLKVWLTTDDKRTPVRFSIGKYQADLVNESNELQK